LPDASFKDPIVQSFAQRLKDPAACDKNKKYFIYRLDTSKKCLVDELPNVAVEQAAMQIFTHMRSATDDHPVYVGFID
jgi:hypothetical protein